MTQIEVTGRDNPEPEELAAIVAAVQVVMHSGAVPVPQPESVSRWRLSVRSWARPIPSRRDRPSAW